MAADFIVSTCRLYFIVNLMLLLGHNLSSIAIADAIVGILMKISIVELPSLERLTLKYLNLLNFSTHVPFIQTSAWPLSMTIRYAFKHSVSLLIRSCSSC